MQSIDERLGWDTLDRLRKAMRVSGHTPGTLADALEVHRNTISNYLSGRVQADRRTLLAWAMATGVPAEWLIDGKTPQPNGPGGSKLPRLDSNQQPCGIQPEKYLAVA